MVAGPLKPLKYMANMVTLITREQRLNPLMANRVSKFFLAEMNTLTKMPKFANFIVESNRGDIVKVSSDISVTHTARILEPAITCEPSRRFFMLMYLSIRSAMMPEMISIQTHS